MVKPVGKPLRPYQANPNSIPKFLPPLPFFEGGVPTKPPRVSKLLRDKMITYRNGPMVTQQELADCMDVSRHTINQLLNDKRSMTANIALRLEKVFGGEPSARFWMEAQSQMDLYEVRKIHLFFKEPK